MPWPPAPRPLPTLPHPLLAPLPGCLTPGRSQDPPTWPQAGRATPRCAPDATSSYLPVLGSVRPSSRPLFPLGSRPRSPWPSDCCSQMTVGKPVSLSLLGQGPGSPTTQRSCKIPGLRAGGHRLTTHTTGSLPFPAPHLSTGCFARLLWSPSPSQLPSLPPPGGRTDLCRCACPHILHCAKKLLGPPFFPWVIYKDSPYLGLGAWPPACLPPRAAHANPSPIRSQKHHALVSHRAFACATALPGLTYWRAAPSGNLPQPPHQAVCPCPPSLFHTCPLHAHPTHFSRPWGSAKDKTSSVLAMKGHPSWQGESRDQTSQ